MGKLTKRLFEGDGLPDDDEALDFVFELELTSHELEGLIEANKREAWVREKMAKYEDPEDNILLAQFFWRRTERWREIKKLYDKRLDETE